MLKTLRVERTGVPIYVQIRDQLLRAIGAGIVQPGDKMPTMRQVAVELRVDLNTVRHAYEALAQTGAVTIRPARGTFVAEKPPKADKTSNIKCIDELALHAIMAARTAGVQPGEVAHRILAILKKQESE